MAKPTIVIVHGAWHSPQHFHPLQKNLESHGYRCVAVSLPSTQSIDTPPATLADDTAAIRDSVTAELDQRHNVVVVAHSYGGCPANNALQNLDTTSRNDEGASTSVVAIAFIAAMPQPAGVVPAKIVDPSDPGANFYFYNDLDDAEATKWSDILRPMSWDALEGETSDTAYINIPSWYLMCTQDNTLPLMAQKMIVQGAIDAGSNMTTESVDSGHSPFLSKIEETSAFVRRAAGEQVI